MAETIDTSQEIFESVDIQKSPVFTRLNHKS